MTTVIEVNVRSFDFVSFQFIKHFPVNRHRLSRKFESYTKGGDGVVDRDPREVSY